MRKQTELYKDLLELNKKFHEKNIMNESFYNELNRFDINYKKSILIEMFPDGNNTYVGSLINQNRELIKFDLDLSDYKFSYLAKHEMSKNLKNDMAYKLFDEISNTLQPMESKYEIIIRGLKEDV